MSEQSKEWLSHLEGSIPLKAKGHAVSKYSIALEGWRRGLTLKLKNRYYRDKKRYILTFSLSYKGVEHDFELSRGDKVSKESIKICMNKDLTKEILSKANVPVPNGRRFKSLDKDKDIIEYANYLGFPLVLKPSDGEGGKGVIANIKNEDEFIDALQYVKYELNYENLIVESHAEGEDYRVYVIEGKVIGAFKKISANVIGDGVNNIKDLLIRKNQERNRNPAFHNRPIRIDTEMHNVLNSVGYSLSSVPKEGERVFLKSKNNISSGGDPIDVTDELTNEMKNISINASKAIPGLVQAGIDMIVNHKDNSCVVIEANSKPGITAHLFPMEGKARDIPKAIIDNYFPETILSPENQNAKLFFDYDHAVNSFKEGVSKEIVVPNIPSGRLLSTSFLISGTLKRVHYEKWVRKRAVNLQLNGYIEELQSGDMIVVVSGSADSIKQFKSAINNESSRKAQVTKIIEKEWVTPIKIGFEIKAVKSQLETENITLIKQIQKLKESNNILQTKKKLYENKYKEIEKSKAWRATKPIRNIGVRLKGILKRLRHSG